ncbi:MAG TPA: hypothetical protein PKH07_03550, partial [bacterium]|nr:hypothetical protein [bacterium]
LPLAAWFVMLCLGLYFASREASLAFPVWNRFFPMFFALMLPIAYLATKSLDGCAGTAFLIALSVFLLIVLALLPPLGYWFLAPVAVILQGTALIFFYKLMASSRKMYVPKTTHRLEF